MDEWGQIAAFADVEGQLGVVIGEVRLPCGKAEIDNRLAARGALGGKGFDNAKYLQRRA